jgi:hypothetical protein
MLFSLNSFEEDVKTRTERILKSVPDNSNNTLKTDQELQLSKSVKTSFKPLSTFQSQQPSPTIVNPSSFLSPSSPRSMHTIQKPVFNNSNNNTFKNETKKTPVMSTAPNTLNSLVFQQNDDVYVGDYAILPLFVTPIQNNENINTDGGDLLTMQRPSSSLTINNSSSLNSFNFDFDFAGFNNSLLMNVAFPLKNKPRLFWSLRGAYLFL